MASNKLTQVLLIENNHERCEWLNEILATAHGYRFVMTPVNAVTEALRHLDHSHYDAVLLSLDDAEFSNLRSLCVQKSNLPIIVLSDIEDDELGAQAVREGAQDYIFRGHLQGNLLARSIRYAIERHRLREELRAMSLRDELTGLYNRRGFMLLAERELKLDQRLRRKLTLFFFDFDGLKRINDSMGHGEGDTALQDTAKILRETFRSSDLIARVGGDEFVVLAMEGSAHPDSHQKRIRKKLDILNQGGNRRYALSLSVGVAYYDPLAPVSLDELMLQADKAMYQDKQQTDPGNKTA